jgi:hypothetical protein
MRPLWRRLPPSRRQCGEAPGKGSVHPALAAGCPTAGSASLSTADDHGATPGATNGNLAITRCKKTLSDDFDVDRVQGGDEERITLELHSLGPYADSRSPTSRRQAPPGSAIVTPQSPAYHQSPAKAIARGEEGTFKNTRLGAQWRGQKRLTLITQRAGIDTQRRNPSPASQDADRRCSIEAAPTTPARPLGSANPGAKVGLPSGLVQMEG